VSAPIPRPRCGSPAPHESVRWKPFHAGTSSRLWRSCVRSASLRDAHHRPREGAGREFPSPGALAHDRAWPAGALFRCDSFRHLRQEGEDFYVGHTIESTLNDLSSRSTRAAWRCRTIDDGSQALTGGDPDRSEFCGRASHGYGRARSGCRGGVCGRPGAHSVDEVLLCSPERLRSSTSPAHRLYGARSSDGCALFSEIAHSENRALTSIRVRLSARVSFIDHALGS